MIDLTQLILNYYGIANWNSGNKQIESMIANYNSKVKNKIPLSSAWCAVMLFNFCNYLKYDIGDANCWVGSWMTTGKEIQREAAQMGDIVIIGDLINQTHITTFVRRSNDGLFAYCLGGNQHQQINIAPFAKTSVCKIIRLSKIN